MRRIDVRDMIAGGVLVAIGLFVALYASSHYQVGTPARMGPGFFPTMMGWILAGLGVIVCLLALRPTIHAITPPPFQLRSFTAVLLSVAAFALLIEHLGLVPTAAIVTVIAAAAETRFKLRRTLLLAASLAVLSWLIFSVGLQMTLPAFADWG